MPNPPPDEDELFVHPGTAGLAELLKVIEAAMVEGRGPLSLGGGCGIVATSSRSSRAFAKATVTFTNAASPDAGRRPGHPAPRAPASPARPRASGPTDDAARRGRGGWPACAFRQMV